MEKKFLSTILLIGFLCSLFTQPGCVSKKDPVVVAKKQTMMQNKTVDENDAKFMSEMADARMMDSKEGELAVGKGTRADNRSDGQLTITDQARLLEEIRSHTMLFCVPSWARLFCFLNAKSRFDALREGPSSIHLS